MVSRLFQEKDWGFGVGAGMGEGGRTVAVHKVCRAVDGVADECRGFGELVAGFVGFFAHEFEVGVLFAERGRDELFDCAVGFGDEVDGWGVVRG